MPVTWLGLVGVHLLGFACELASETSLIQLLGLVVFVAL